MTDQNQTDSKAPKPSKPAKASGKAPFFDQLKAKLSKMSETELGIIAGVIFVIGYLGFQYVTMPVLTPQNAGGISAPVQAVNSETEEQRFKRENKNANLPDGSAVPKDIVEKKTQLTQQVPFGDKELEFRVRLPSTWVMSQFARYGLPGEENYAVLTNIARYFGPAIEDARPFLWVEAERIKRYMTAETWARAYMITRGIAPEALQVVSPTEVQALYVDVRDTRSYAVRSLFRVEGDTMVMVSFGTPVEEYKSFKDMMGLVLGSFHLVRPIDRQIEQINQYKLLSVMKFDYYNSWKPKNQIAESTLRPSIELHNPQEVNNPKGELLQGIILVHAWRKTPQVTDETCMKEITDRIQELRMEVKEPLGEPENLALHDNFISIQRTQYKAQVNTYVRRDKFDIMKSEESKTNQEVWITRLDNDYYVAYITLITPVKSTNYVIWSQNIEAYNLLAQTLFVRGAPSTE